MTGDDLDMRDAEMERINLLNVISQVETVLAVSTPINRGILERVLEGAKGRVQMLERKIKDAEVERESHSREQAAIAHMVEREKALSAEERETYGGFLRKEFFTKSDFGSLEKFYKNTWSRLSESGKDEMSHRVWEGIRRDEYTFGELPQTVREKETDRAYAVLKLRETDSRSGSGIPQKDREDFVRAYENGDRAGASKVLERDSFKENMFRSSESKPVKQVRAETGRDAAGDNIERAAMAPTQNALQKPATAAAGKSEIDVAAFGLEGVKLSEAPEEISSAEVKNATAAAPSNPSLRRG